MRVAAVLCACLLAPPAAASETFPANIRPFFSVGPSFPVDFESVGNGFGSGFGFEAEQSSRVSVLFRVEWYRMRGEVPPPEPFYTPPAWTLTTINWSLGARAYLGTHGPIRSYVDGGVGVRLVRDDHSIILAAGAAAGPSAVSEGLAVILRFGLSSAGARRPDFFLPGFFLDSGVDLMAENPARYGLVSVRLGVIFP